MSGNRIIGKPILAVLCFDRVRVGNQQIWAPYPSWRHCPRPCIRCRCSHPNCARDQDRPPLPWHGCAVLSFLVETDGRGGSRGSQPQESAELRRELLPIARAYDVLAQRAEALGDQPSGADEVPTASC